MEVEYYLFYDFLRKLNQILNILHIKTSLEAKFSLEIISIISMLVNSW